MRCIPMKRRAAKFNESSIAAIAESVAASDLAPFQREADAQGVPLDDYLAAWTQNIIRQARGDKRH